MSGTTYKSNYNLQRTPFWQCDRKRQFTSKETAVARADEIKASGGPDMRAHECRHCGGYHLARRK